MSKHLADHRTLTTGARLRHFLRLARATRQTFHRSHARPGQSRLVQFLRIARGRTA